VSAIDEYVAALGRRLVGPERLVRDMLTEARDSLTDAADAFQHAGLDPHAAEQRAVAEFGSVSRIAPAYQRELAATYSQRLAGLLALVLIGTALLGDRMWQGAPWTGFEPPGQYGTVARALDWVGPVGMVTAIAGFLLLRWQSRRGSSDGRLANAVGYATTAVLGAVVVLGAAIYAYTVAVFPQALTWPPMIVGGLVLTSALTYLTWTAARCVAALRAARTT
jgi:hypothetical protein